MRPLRVLLVEDDEDDFVITRDLLAEIEHTDYELEWVDNAEDALARLVYLKNDYDVCLLDYRLGRTTGIEIIRKVLSEGLNVPMILLTEHSDRQIDLTAMQEGASDFLVKAEINSRILDRAIRYVCAVKKHEQERLSLALALEARKQAEAANRSKDEFLGMVSHEMRGPINSMLLWIDILKSPDTDPETLKTGIEALERSIRQQSYILNNLVEFTRGLNRTIKLYKQTVNLVDLLKDIVTAQQPVADKKHIALSFSHDAAELILQADPDRLQQIFSNLISNSIKFTQEHGRVKIRADRRGDKDKPYAEITVCDNGIGISAELLPYVFDRYLQAPTHSYGNNTGLGLGLTIARQLVELHDGTIRAESPGINLGTTFHVGLPLS
ncbi:hybrid sensor histidine kinase/response regulator [Methylosarcina fibrata]|uniref:hybrid sensor histidine kinase/response regulator n=1 Tax=Methylosarcina fibrata TaxID=105972 RepID=UPI0003652ADC|nr:hybrid sensor histidine kinase/response regulator [Methylosarcina fibrata]